MSDESMDAMQAMSAPAEEHARLRPFVGTFRAEVKIWMGPGDPMISTGTMTNTMDLGGRFLRQDYKGDPGGGPFPDFEGRGFWGYNKSTQHYEGFWIDTASTIMQNESGSVDDSGRVWTMIGEIPDGSGGKTTKRSVITVQDDDHHSMEMYFDKDGQELKGMEIRYTRA
jgi:hypothetical protein